MKGSGIVPNSPGSCSNRQIVKHSTSLFKNFSDTITLKHNTFTALY